MAPNPINSQGLAPAEAPHFRALGGGSPRGGRSGRRQPPRGGGPGRTSGPPDPWAASDRASFSLLPPPSGAHREDKIFKFFAGFWPIFGQTWPQNPSRRMGLVLQCRLHQKSAPQINYKTISWQFVQYPPSLDLVAPEVVLIGKLMKIVLKPYI